MGKLGPATLSPGHYLYTGSARAGLEARLARHFRREKRKHWHIDYLLEHASPVLAVVFTGGEEECEVNGLVEDHLGYPPAVRGFGASDCHCWSHLHYLDDAEVEGFLSHFPPERIWSKERFHDPLAKGH